MRFFIVAILLALTAIASADRSFYSGRRKFGDYLIEQKKVEKTGWPYYIVEKTEYIVVERTFRITRVEIIDLQKNEFSAKPMILSGGHGQSYVTVKFVSSMGHGIHYDIKVYGIYHG